MVPARSAILRCLIPAITATFVGSCEYTPGAGARLASTPATTAAAPICDDPDPSWIWCDDFEEDRFSSYFEVEDANQSMRRAPGIGRDGSWGLRAHWAPGQIGAGNLKIAFGRTPQRYIRPVDRGRTDHREIFWRVRVRYPEDWEGGGAEKLSRATSLVNAEWAQAMIAHVWSGGEGSRHLALDPASGTDELGTLRTRKYNDFDRLRWLGIEIGKTPIFGPEHLGRWICVEARVRLNDPGLSNGAFQLWIDDRLEASREDLNWVGVYDEYGINAVFLENYWNDGSPRAQSRDFDDFVVATARIGC